MVHHVKDGNSVLRGVAAQRRYVAPKRTLLVSLIAASAYLPPACAKDDGAKGLMRRTSGIVMIVGGMTSGGDAVVVPARSAPSESFSTSDDTGGQSVVIQPGRTPLNDVAPQTSATVPARVAALSSIINEAARIADVDSALLMAVIDVESGGNPQAISPKGAVGLMQLMPSTGTRHGASNLFDPRQNVAAGARYLKELLRQFGELPLALAAYNAGEGAVQKYGGRVPPYAETISYVPKVIARYRWYKYESSSPGVVSVEDVPDTVHGRISLVGSRSTD